MMSAALIIARRQGQKASNIFRSKYLMITDNSAVSSVTKRYVVESKGYLPRQVGPVIPLSRIAAAIWIDGGLAKGMSISRTQLLATCAKTTALNPALIERIRNNIRQISPDNADKYLSLLAQPRYMQIANDKAFGGAKEATAEFTIEWIEEVKAEILAPEREAHSEQLKAIEKDQRTKERLRLASLKQAQSAEESALRQLEKSMVGRLNRARQRGTRFGTAVQIGAVSAGVMISMAIAFFEFMENDRPLYFVAKMCVAAAVLILTVCSIFSWGISLRKLSARVADWFVSREVSDISRDYEIRRTDFGYQWSEQEHTHIVTIPKRVPELPLISTQEP